MKSILAWIAFIFILTGLFSSAVASPVILKLDMDTVKLGPHLGVLADRQKTLTYQDVSSATGAKKFIATHDEIPNFGMTSAPYWVRVTLISSSEKEEAWIFGIELPLMDRIDLYIEHAGQEVEHRQGGSLMPLHQREIKSHRHLFQIKTAPYETIRIYARLQTESTMYLDLTIASIQGFQKAEESKQWLYGISFGMLLTLLLFNFLLFVQLGDKSYAYLLGILGSALLYFLGLSGMSAVILWPDSPVWATKSTMLFCGLTELFALLFFSAFLEVPKQDPRIYQGMRLFMLVAIAGGTLGLINYLAANYILSVSGLILLIFSTIYPAVQWRRGNSIAGFLLMAWIFMLVSGIYFTITALGYIPANQTLIYCWPIGFNVGGVLFTFTLGYRYSIIQKRLHQDLEIKISARTKQLSETVQALQNEVTERQRAEQTIREKEEHYRLVADNTSDVIWTVDLDLNCTYVSPSVRRVLGFSVEEIMGLPLPAILFPDSFEWIMQTTRDKTALQKMSAELLEIPPVELEILTKSGGRIWTESTVTFLRDPEEQIIGLAGVTRDISDRRRSEAALRESEERYRLMANNVTDIIWAIDKNLNCIYISPAIKRVLGYEVEEIQGHSLPAIVFPESFAMVQQAARDGIAQSQFMPQEPIEVPPFELEMETKSGSRIWTESRSTFLRDAKGNTLGVIGVTRDITERRRTEKALRESEERYRLLANNVTDVIWTMDLKLNFTYRSPSVVRLRGFSMEEVATQGLADVLAPASMQLFLEKWQEQLQLEASGAAPHRTMTLDLEMRCKNGSTVWTEVTVTDLRDAQGKIIGLLGVTRDISDRRRSEAALRESEERYRLLAHNVTDVIWTMDLSFKFTYRSPSIERLRGYTLEEAATHTLDQILTPASIQLFLEKWQEQLQIENTGAPLNRTLVLELEMYHKNGATVWTEVKGSILRDSSGKAIGVLGVTRDISERKRTEEALKYRLDLVVLMSAISMMFINLKAEEIDQGISQALEQIGRYTKVDRCFMFLKNEDGTEINLIHGWFTEGLESRKQNLQGLKIENFTWWMKLLEQSNHIYLHDLSELPAEAVFEKKVLEMVPVQSILAVALRQQGQLVGFLGYATVFQPKTWGKEDIALLETMAGVFVNAIDRQQVGRELAKYSEHLEELVEERTSDLTKANEQLHRDMLERIKAETEKEELENKLRQSQKMEAIGRLAGGVAHDFNNILTGITGYIELILAAQPPGDSLAVDLQEIRKAALRATDLTNQLLAFSRKQIISPQIVDLNEIVDSGKKMLGRIIGEDMQLQFTPKSDLWRIKADPSQINQILINLAANSRDAMPHGGKIIVETNNIYLDERFCFTHPEAEPGPYIILSVTDNGLGIDPEILKHIFEPFFSTKEKGKGTGLGLATVYGIVTQNKGFITVSSDMGLGTTFKIYFPRAEGSPTVADRSTRINLPLGTETVLIVEDEEMVRRLAIRILEKQGYKILEAQDGYDALSKYEYYEGKIDLLLSDVIMPNMNGKELFENLRRGRPMLRVLYMSGYSEDAIAHHGVLDEGTNFIQKPFNVDSLTKKVYDVLRN